jgi:hypothetical protein
MSKNGGGGRMNPAITTIEIGKRELKPLTLYPLSIPDQIEVSELITEALQAFFDKGKKQEALEDGVLPEEMENLVFVAFLINLIQKNLVKILSLITDYSDKQIQKIILPEITNEQAADIAIIVFRVNYERPAKNVLSLFKGKVATIVENLPNDSLKRLLQPLWGDSPSTESNISSDAVSETAD